MTYFDYSVGVKEGDDKEFKFDSLQMHGTEAMSTQDVFEYFKDYAPTSIEWINDESCECCVLVGEYNFICFE